MQITKEQEEKFLLAAEIIRKGLRWELANTLDRLPGEELKWKEGGNLTQLMQLILSSPFSIRPYEGSFPKLPEGETWHNPHGINPNELPKGFRLITKAERGNEGSNHWLYIGIKERGVDIICKKIDTPIIIRTPYTVTSE